MSLLEKLQEDLREVSGAVARAERVARDYPNIPSVAASLRTIRKRQENLQAQFAEVANDLGLEVCTYRIEYDRQSQASVAAVTAALSDFQRLFTAVYDALTNKRKKIASWSEEAVAATTLNFGYTFQGSLGVAMTLPNDRALLGESMLDAAMRETLDLISAPSPERVDNMTEKLGVSAVRIAHQWALDNQKAGFGADIVWRGGDKYEYAKRIQKSQVSELANTIGSAFAREKVVIVGSLMHVNIFDGTFQMEGPHGVINGTIGHVISEKNQVTLPKKYSATLEVSTKVASSETGEQVTYTLLKLEPYPPPDAGKPGFLTA